MVLAHDFIFVMVLIHHPCYDVNWYYGVSLCYGVSLYYGISQCNGAINKSPLGGSHSLSVQRARRLKSRGPKGPQLGVGLPVNLDF